MSKKGAGLPALLAFLLGSILGYTALGFAQAQTFGTISGTISDVTGAVIPGAKITAANKGTGAIRTTTTNESGYYAVLNLPAGTYDVTAEKVGFERCANIGVQLDPAATVQLTCSMKVGQVTTTVEVQAAALIVQTEDPKVSRVLNPTQITEMPTNGRNFVSLFGLMPGVIQEFTFNSFEAMDPFAEQSTHVNGLRGDSNNLMIEGSPSTRTRANGAYVAAPSLDAIGEINIVTTGYMPEYSRQAGGQIAVQMKSGTTAYHGGAYEFLRNDAMDARNFFSSTVSTIKYNNFGYTFGGPVIPHKNKLFFFWNQEWSRFPSSYPYTAVVPSLLARGGNFSEYCAPNSGTPCPTVPAYLNGKVVGGNTLVAGQPFPNDTIDPSLWSPNGTAFMDMLAKPTTSGIGTNWFGSMASPENDRRETVKVDVYLDKIKSHLGVALRHYISPEWDAGMSGSSKLLNWEILLPSRGATVDLTTNFSPTLLNDLSLTATEDIVHVMVPNGAGLDRSALGITFPYLLGDASKDVPGKIPTLNIGQGIDGPSGLPYPSSSVGKVWVIQDVLTKIRGKHTFKAGIWIEQDGENDRDQVRITPGAASGIGNNMNGTFSFYAATTNPATTGSPLADLLLGNYDSYSELGFRNYTPWVAWQKGVFAQDSWRVGPRLTIEGGLRWDFFPPYHSRWCNFSTFDPLFYSRSPGVEQTVDPVTGYVTGGNPYNGIAVPCQELPPSAIGHFGVFGERLTSSDYDAINAKLRDTGMLRGLAPEIFQKHYDNWQPRLGFAWDPIGKGTTSIRGSGGIFYNHFTLSDVTLMGGNTPFQPALLSLNGRADCPGLALDAERNCLTGSGVIPQLPLPITGGDLISQMPEVYQWSFNVQHMLPQDTLVEVGYVGTRGKHLVLNTDTNQVVPGVIPANPGVNINALRPYPGLAQTTVGLNDSSSRYDSLQVSVQRRLTKGLQYGLAYTYSNSFDHGSSLYATAVNAYDLRYTWGPTDWNRRNNLIINYVYQLPFFKGQNNLAGRIAGGWELSGVIAFQSGTPNTISNLSGDEAQVGEDFGQTANRLAGCNPNSAPRNLTEWFNTACFAEATTGTFGNAGRNSVWGPYFKNWDFALFKGGKVTEKLGYQLRGEFFNFLNHPNFGGLSTGLGSSNFGALTSATDPRVVQVGLKLNF